MISLKQFLKENSVDEIEDMHNRLQNHYSNFSKNEISGIKNYTYTSRHLNSDLWDAHINKDKDHPIFHHDNLKNMDSATNRHKTPDDMTVYSGIGYSPKKLIKNKIYHNPAFISTSLDPKIAEDFAAYNASGGPRSDEDFKIKNKNLHILKIHVPKGHPGTYAAHHSYYGIQREFILPRGTNLRHVKTSTYNFAHYELNDNLGMLEPQNKIYKVHEHHMEIVK